MGLLASQPAFTGHLCRLQILRCDPVRGSSRVSEPGQSQVSSNLKPSWLPPTLGGLLLLSPQNRAPAGPQDEGRCDLVYNGHQQSAVEQHVLAVVRKGVCWTPTAMLRSLDSLLCLSKSQGKCSAGPGEFALEASQAHSASDGTPPLPLWLLQAADQGKTGIFH